MEFIVSVHELPAPNGEQAPPQNKNELGSVGIAVKVTTVPGA